MIHINEFIQNVAKLVENRTGTKPKVHDVIKNNGVRLSVISIPRDDVNITPTIYLQDFYEEYLEGKCMDEIIDEILKLDELYKMEKDFDVKKFLDFKTAKGQIVYKVINYEKNAELLKEVPHQRILDLAKIYVFLVNEESMHATITIHNAQLRLWGITEEELFSVAEKNTPELFPEEFETIENVIMSMGGYEVDIRGFANQVPMFVLTNKKKVNGAASIFYSNVLERIANEKGYDLFVLPSSLHETVIIPYKASDLEDIKKIVKEINDTQVELEDRLSDSVYVYRREKKALVIA